MIVFMFVTVMANNADSYDCLEGLGADYDQLATVTVLSPNAVKVLKAMCKIACILGLADAVIGTCLPGLLPQLFTPDAAVACKITQTAPISE